MKEVICKDGKPAFIGDHLEGEADGKPVSGILVEGNAEAKTGKLLPVGKIGQSVKDVGIAVSLPEMNHAAKPLTTKSAA